MEGLQEQLSLVLTREVWGLPQGLGNWLAGNAACPLEKEMKNQTGPKMKQISGAWSQCSAVATVCHASSKWSEMVWGKQRLWHLVEEQPWCLSPGTAGWEELGLPKGAALLYKDPVEVSLQHWCAVVLWCQLANSWSLSWVRHRSMLRGAGGGRRGHPSTQNVSAAVAESKPERTSGNSSCKSSGKK